MYMLLRSSWGLYAPSGLHKGFLTMMRVWVQAAAYSDSICFNTGGVSCGVSCGVLFLGEVWVVGLRDIDTCGTTCHPPGSLMCWSCHSVCWGVCLRPLRCLVTVGGYGGTAGGLVRGLLNLL